MQLSWDAGKNLNETLVVSRNFKKDLTGSLIAQLRHILDNGNVFGINVNILFIDDMRKERNISFWKGAFASFRFQSVSWDYANDCVDGLQVPGKTGRKYHHMV